MNNFSMRHAIKFFFLIIVKHLSNQATSYLYQNYDRRFLMVPLTIPCTDSNTRVQSWLSAAETSHARLSSGSSYIIFIPDYSQYNIARMVFLLTARKRDETRLCSGLNLLVVELPQSQSKRIESPAITDTKENHILINICSRAYNLQKDKKHCRRPTS